jgi:hypothetical protein
VRTEAVFFVAGVALVGGIALGKSAVDAAYKLPPLPVGAKNRPVIEESIRLVATLVGLGVSIVHLPRAWEEAQKLAEEIA